MAGHSVSQYPSMQAGFRRTYRSRLDQNPLPVQMINYTKKLVFGDTHHLSVFGVRIPSRTPALRGSRDRSPRLLAQSMPGATRHAATANFGRMHMATGQRMVTWKLALARLSLSARTIHIFVTSPARQNEDGHRCEPGQPDARDPSPHRSRQIHHTTSQVPARAGIVRSESS